MNSLIIVHKVFIYLFTLICVFELKAQSKKPNVIIILTDDMGYSDIGSFGSEIRTPNIDRLASNGLRFTHFYNTARCSPTRASLLTGLYPHQANMGNISLIVPYGLEIGNWYQKRETKNVRSDR